MQDVTVNRHKYIGGSDVPIIMGISPFKKRYKLLLEKAQIEVSEFTGNKFTDYGNKLEPLIRDYINTVLKRNFLETKIVEEGEIIGFRYHSDGDDEKEKELLEIKTTSVIHEEVTGYKSYLVQLLSGMIKKGYKKGVLAVYKRPADFDATFNEDYLTIYHIDINDYKELCDEIIAAMDKFRVDLELVLQEYEWNDRVIPEAELMGGEIAVLANKITLFEDKLVEMKLVEKQIKEFKTQLKLSMEKEGIKSFQTPNKTKITLVEDKKDEEIEVEVLDTEKWTVKNETLINEYEESKKEFIKTEMKTKKGRAGHVKITPVKKERE